VRSAQLKMIRKISEVVCLPTRFFVTSGFYTHEPVRALDIRKFATVTRGVGRIVRVTCKYKFQVDVRCVEIVIVFDYRKTETKGEQNDKKREHSSFFQKIFCGIPVLYESFVYGIFVYDNFFEESDNFLAEK